MGRLNLTSHCSNFTKFSNLTNHVRVVHDGVRFVCPLDTCRQAFASRRTLAAHSQKHRNEVRNSDKSNSLEHEEVISKAGKGEGLEITGTGLKARARRKDKGMPKKSMATFLTSVDIGVQAEKILLADNEIPISASEIQEELNTCPDLVTSVLNDGIRKNEKEWEL